tara:strand:- start:1970 stop:2251 length:282 start_codon:yes stop_codon:yes gene_type:complete
LSPQKPAVIGGLLSLIGVDKVKECKQREEPMFTLGLLMILGSLFFLGRYFYLKKKAEEERNFVVIGTSLLLLWLFPGSALFILGAIILLILLF